MLFHKYQGAGNDFLIADNRDGSISLSTACIAALCDRRYGVGADGVMLLEEAPEPYGFRMVYYNSDGSGGMMCGNGGRCIVAFADSLGLPVGLFLAPDGPHRAEILAADGLTRTVRLQMKDVEPPVPVAGGLFLDTGTRHFVLSVANIDTVDVEGLGRSLRHSPDFAPGGANINFAQWRGSLLHVRTYEKGVEAETYACGTGITAAAIACAQRLCRPTPFRGQGGSPLHVDVQALRDRLAVDFTPTPAGGATDVWLTGPATFVADIHLPQQ